MGTNYFYIIRHKETGRKYAGCQFAVNADPQKFMKPGGYKTSSKEVKQRIQDDGLDAFEILQLLSEDVIGMDVLLYETRFLQDNKISSRPDWMNMHNNEMRPMTTKEYREKLNSRYGVDNIFQSDSYREKQKKTNQKKYGTDYASQGKPFREQVVETCNRAYGVDNVSQTKEVKDKKIATCMENFGVAHPMQSAEVMEKQIATSMARYGVTHPSKTEPVKESMRETCVERYGVDHYQKTEESREKNSKRLSNTVWIRRVSDGKFFQVKKDILPTLEYEWVKDDPVNSKMKANPIICEHCGKSQTKANHVQFHGDRCKLKGATKLDI